MPPSSLFQRVTPLLFVFQCSGNTYMECIEKGVVGSNDPWPLQVKAGDACLLQHYEYDTLFILPCQLVKPGIERYADGSR